MRLELPTTFIPFKNTAASIRLAEFCCGQLGCDTSGTLEAISGLAALRTVLGTHEAEVANSLFKYSDVLLPTATDGPSGECAPFE
jgi:hypothetical protein